MAKGSLGVRISTAPPGVIKRLQNFFTRNRTSMIGKRVGQSVDRFAKILKEETPVDTGALRRAQNVKKTGAMSWSLTETGPRAKIGAIIRAGIPRPYTISPRTKQALFWPGAAHPVKIVRRNPVAPNDYWERAIKQSQSEFNKAAKQIGQDIAAEVTKV